MGLLEEQGRKFNQLRRTLGGKTTVETGNEFQNRVRRDLKKKGYSVSKPSTRHCDWIAKKGKVTWFVECKFSKRPSVSLAEHKFLKGKENVMVAYRNKTGRIAYLKH